MMTNDTILAHRPRRPETPRRTVLAALGGLIMAAALCAGAGVANAIEVECIDASKYKYLFEIFGKDRRKFAEFFGVSPANLPDGEMCRAIILSGGIDSSAKSRETRQPTDTDKLLDVIARNKGWLATIYLVSPGGNIAMGMSLSQMTRMFWLKTEAPNAKIFKYTPDFIMRATPPANSETSDSSAVEVPPELAQGWEAYLRLLGEGVGVALSGSGRCASACTFLHVAGIERQGTVHVHRGRRSQRNDPKGGIDANQSMAEVLEGLHRAEAQVIALYRSMDSGEQFVSLFQSTPTATTRPAASERIPRYVADILQAKCGADAARLTALEGRLRATIAEAGDKSATAAKTGRLNSQLSTLLARRTKVEQCIAAAQEKERLTQFAKFCANGCDRALVTSTIRSKNEPLSPARAQPTPAPQTGREPRRKN